MITSSILIKILAIIESCKTTEQLKTCESFITNPNVNESFTRNIINDYIAFKQSRLYLTN